MSKTRKVLLEVLLAIVCAIMAVFGVFGLHTKSAKAEEAKDFYVYGASVRQADGVYSTAIKFHVLMSDKFYEDHKVGTDEQDVEVGVVILPERLLGANDLTLTTEDAIVTETADVWHESTLVDGYMESIAFVYDIPATEYGTDLAIVGYYKADGAETVYTDKVTGSLAWVAKESGMNGLENYYTFTVTYKDGDSTTTESVEYGEKATQKAQATPKKYVAKGWKNGADAWDFANDTVKKNVTLEAQYELAPAKTAFGFESADELTYVEKDGNYGLDVEIVNYAEEAQAYQNGEITVPANFKFSAHPNGESSALKLSNRSSGGKAFGFKCYFNETVPAGTVISFNLAINVGDSTYTSDNGWVPYYIGDAGNAGCTWYQYDNAYWHQLNTATGGFYWAKVTYTLVGDSDYIRIGQNGDNGNSRFVTESTLVMYVDNLMVLDSNKSTFDFSWLDTEYLTVSTNAGNISYVDYATENAQTNANGVGKLTNLKGTVDPSNFGKMLKWSDSGVTMGTGGDKSISLDFGKTLKAGTTISFNLFVYNATVTDNAWFSLVLREKNGSTVSGWDQSRAYWANTTPWGQHWTTVTYTLSNDATGIVFAPNLGAGATDGTVNGTLDFYFDNIAITVA